MIPQNRFGLLGIFPLLSFAWMISRNRKVINYHVIVGGLIIQGAVSPKVKQA